MYLIDKLEILYQSQKDDTIEFILSQYLLMNISNISGLSLKRISSETKVSHSSIIRFCQNAGFSGYTLFINELQYEKEQRESVLQFYDHLDFMNLEKQKNIFMDDCRIRLKNVYAALLKSLKESQNIVFYGHNQYISCFQNCIESLYFKQKNVIRNMCWEKQNQKEIFHSLDQNVLIIIIEPQKDWRSYKELLTIKEDTIEDLNTIEAKKIYIGQGKNSEINISISIPYTYFEMFYKEFLLELDMMLTIDIMRN